METASGGRPVPARTPFSSATRACIPEGGTTVARGKSAALLRCSPAEKGLTMDIMLRLSFSDPSSGRIDPKPPLPCTFRVAAVALYAEPELRRVVRNYEMHGFVCNEVAAHSPARG